MESQDRLEVRFTVSPEYMKRLQEKLGVSRASEITRSALTLLDWAVGEAEEGRVILSANRDGSDVHRLAMSELTDVKKR